MLPSGELPEPFALEMRAMDMVVHGWDVARATGQQVHWNQQLVAETLQSSEATFSAMEFRGTDFVPPVELSGDPDGLSRLVAFLGRQP